MKVIIDNFKRIAIEISKQLPNKGKDFETRELLTHLLRLAKDDTTFINEILNEKHQYDKIDLNLNITKNTLDDKRKEISQIIKNKANGNYINTNPYNFIGEMYYIANKLVKLI